MSNWFSKEDLQLLRELLVQVAIAFIVSTAMMTLVSGLPLGQTMIGGAIVTMIIVASYHYMFPRPVS